jgi:hypothetical protein
MYYNSMLVFGTLLDYQFYYNQNVFNTNNTDLSEQDSKYKMQQYNKLSCFSHFRTRFSKILLKTITIKIIYK